MNQRLSSKRSSMKPLHLWLIWILPKDLWMVCQMSKFVGLRTLLLSRKKNWLWLVTLSFLLRSCHTSDPSFIHSETDFGRSNGYQTSTRRRSQFLTVSILLWFSLTSPCMPLGLSKTCPRIASHLKTPPLLSPAVDIPLSSTHSFKASGGLRAKKVLRWILFNLPKTDG